jgi:hypothetical protein
MREEIRECGDNLSIHSRRLIIIRSIRIDTVHPWLVDGVLELGMNNAQR